MRNLKRVFTSVLALAVVLSCMTFSVGATDFPDVPADHPNRTAISQLSDLGVIEGDDTGNFNPDANVNRAEFTALVMRFIGQSDTSGLISVENAPFPDLTDSSVSWAIGDITVARNMGIINGYEDGTFRPTNPVNYEEAVKMIVCALGYGNAITPATDASQWYVPYMTVANEMGFTRNSGGSVGVPSTRASIAQMLYDALNVKTLDSNGNVSDSTVLDDRLNSNKASGTIISNDVTSLESPDVTTRENQIQILTREDGEEDVYTYTISNDRYLDWIGYQVDFYYTTDRSDDSRTLVSATKKSSSKEVTVKANDLIIEDSTETSIAYYPEDSSRDRTYSLDSDNVVIYNGKLYGSSASSSSFDPSMLPIVGEVTLVDGSGDGKYDVVKIDNYDVYVVTATNSSDKIITDAVSGETRTLTLDVDDTSAELSIVDTDGKEVSFSTITKDNTVVCYQESNVDNGGELIKRAVVCKDYDDGTVRSVNSEEIRIDDTTYPVSFAAPWVLNPDNDDMPQPESGDSARFLFDANGAVVAYTTSTTTTRTAQYGYIVDVATESNLDDYVAVYMLTSGNKLSVYYTDRNTEFGGQKASSLSEVESILEESAALQNTDSDNNATIQQLVKFTTKSNDATVLDEVYLATETDNVSEEVKSDELTRFTPVSAATAMTYSTSSRQLKSDNAIITLSSSAKVFFVPTSRTQTSEYSTGTYSSLKNGHTYYVEAFDAYTRMPNAIVVYGDENATDIVDATTPVYLITSLTEESNSNEGGQSMDKIEGLRFSSSSNGSSFEMWISSDSDLTRRDLAEGDIVRFTTDNDGYAVIKSDGILLDVEALGQDGQYWIDDSMDSNLDRSDWADAEFFAVNAAVDSYNANTGYLNLSEELLGGGEVDGSTMHNIDISRFDSATLLTYRVSANGDVEIPALENSDGEDVTAEDFFSTMDQGTQVFLYVSNGNGKLAVKISDAN